MAKRPKDLSPLMDKVGRLRAERRMQFKALADAAGVAQSQINRWFKAEGEPSAYQARGLAELFGVSLDWLTDDADADLPATRGHAPQSHTLTEEQKIMIIIKKLGFDVATQRLLGLPPVPAVDMVQPGYRDEAEAAARPPAKPNSARRAT